MLICDFCKKPKSTELDVMPIIYSMGPHVSPTTFQEILDLCTDCRIELKTKSLELVKELKGDV